MGSQRVGLSQDLVTEQQQILLQWEQNEQQVTMNTVDSHLSPLSLCLPPGHLPPKRCGFLSVWDSRFFRLHRDHPPPLAAPATVYKITWFPAAWSGAFSPLSLIILNYLPLITNLGFWKSNHYCRYKEPGTTLDHSENTLSTTGQQRIRSYRTSNLLMQRCSLLKGPIAHLQCFKPARSSNRSRESESTGEGRERGNLQFACYTGI